MSLECTRIPGYWLRTGSVGIELPVAVAVGAGAVEWLPEKSLEHAHAPAATAVLAAIWPAPPPSESEDVPPGRHVLQSTRPFGSSVHS